MLFHNCCYVIFFFDIKCESNDLICCVLEPVNQCYVVETSVRNTVLKVTLNHDIIEQLK